MASTQNSTAQPTVDELIATLNDTSLPTLICEGSDDLIVYRRLEERLSHLNVSVLPAGGRLNVLQIFDRRNEILKPVKLAFVVDQDTWINSGIPTQYIAPALCLTTGYSIENDVIHDNNLEALLMGSAATRYRAELHEFLDWYALALARHLSNSDDPISLHPNHVLNPDNRSELLKLRVGESYPTAIKTALLADYKKLIRGKSLLALILRNTNNRPGQPRHSDKALLEQAAVCPGPLVLNLFKSIETIIKA